MSTNPIISGLNKLLSKNEIEADAHDNSTPSDPQKVYEALDAQFVPLDRSYIKRSKNLRLLPLEPQRRGGKYAYGDWAHVIGVFQTLMYMHLDKKEDNVILDVGCGTGLLGISAEPFLGGNGKFVGIDVLKEDIEFCNSHYPQDKYSFQHLDVHNTVYTPEQGNKNLPWDIKDNSFDLVTALSVWTHMDEDTAFYYFKEVSRVLKPGGKAIITFFYLDDLYQKSLPLRKEGEKGRYHNTPQTRWVFANSAYDSKHWFCVGKTPEKAIGVDVEGLAKLEAHSGLKRIAYYPGNWKEIPGVYFQDVLIFQK